MSQQLRQIDPEKLISMLRGEIGEIIQSWIVLNIYTKKTFDLQTNDLKVDMENKNLNLLNLVKSKFRDDIISRLSELTSTKYGRLNFQFASDKFKAYQQEVKEFRKYLIENHLISRRNKNIAHKEISPTWDEINPMPHISKLILARGIARAISLMKGFDKIFYGEEYRQLWKEERKRRYELEIPAAAKYMLLPYVAGIKTQKSEKHT